MIETHKHGNYHKLKLFIKHHVQLLKDHVAKIAVKGSVIVVQPSVTAQGGGTTRYGRTMSTARNQGDKRYATLNAILIRKS